MGGCKDFLNNTALWTRGGEQEVANTAVTAQPAAAEPFQKKTHGYQTKRWPDFGTSTVYNFYGTLLF